jgi:hypothetical protein
MKITPKTRKKMPKGKGYGGKGSKGKPISKPKPKGK